MILPIVAYGDAVLKKVAADIPERSETLDLLIRNMWDTMYNAYGVGLAAPQVNQSLRLFIVDTQQILDKKKKKNKHEEDDEDEDDDMILKPGEKGIKQVFINAQITKRSGREFMYNEGCLSIPSIREDIQRESEIEMTYLDANWQSQTTVFDGLAARVIQHEYDHIEGILFTDHLKSLRRTMLRGKLENISKGKVEVDYRMSFPQMKRRS